MDTSDLVPLIELLDDNVDDLQEALSPLLQSTVSDTAGKLPVLDKAQLYVLVTYAIESVLFSYLRLNGVNAKEHPVFRELTRVKQYFEKIKNVDSVDMSKRSMAVDKAAAGRFIKHALAGNKPPGINQADQNENIKVGSRIQFVQVSKKRKIHGGHGALSPPQALSNSSSESEQSTSDSTAPEPGAQLAVQESKQKRQRQSKRKERQQQRQANGKGLENKVATMPNTPVQSSLTDNGAGNGPAPGRRARKRARQSTAEHG